MENNPDLLLEQYKFVYSRLRKGKKNAVTSHQLYDQYKAEGGKKSYDVFFRLLKLEIAHLRKKGVHIIGDNNGYYVMESDEEWEIYKEKTRSHICSMIRTVADCENKSFGQIAKQLVFLQKDKGKDKGVSTEQECLNLI